MREADIQSAIRLALGRDPDVLLYRNTAGVASIDGRTQRFGLCRGAADLCGILTVHGVGVSLWIEVKRPSQPLSPGQKLFRDLVTARGGVYLVATSAQEAREQVERARVRLRERMR